MVYYFSIVKVSGSVTPPQHRNGSTSPQLSSGNGQILTRKRLSDTNIEALGNKKTKVVDGQVSTSNYSIKLFNLLFY